ncbi:MAG: DUF4236 domain-containing protein [Gemmatimonadota bacterium]|nr:DUF4236 domain-containing protein [Gemmatimonadota bacterium]
MGFRYYKRVNLGGGFHLNLSKTGIGISGGIPGARYSVHSSGRTVRTVGLPGTGLYYRKDTYAKKGSAPRTSGPSRQRHARPVAPAVVMYPKAGLFAPKEDKAFVRGVTSYMRGQPSDALDHLEEAIRLNRQAPRVSEQLFAGMCLIALDRPKEAIPHFESVMASHQPVPDDQMTKYRVDGHFQIQITPEVEATMPMSSLSAALMLAELYQHTEQPQRAIELLESLGNLTGQPVFALSLAELYTQADRPDDVLRVSEDFTTNQDNLTAQLLVFRAGALADKGLSDAALVTLKEAMRFRSRDPAILREARYLRAMVFDKVGKRALSKKDLERIYAEDPRFLDVAGRLGLQPEIVTTRPDM